MTAGNVQEILARLDALAHEVEKIEKRTGTIEQLQRETNGRVKGLELWKARVDGALSVGRNPIVAAIASGTAVAIILTALHIA